MNRGLRLFMLAVGIIQGITGIGFALQIDAFTALWPFSYTNAMAFTFIGSVSFAASASHTSVCPPITLSATCR